METAETLTTLDSLPIGSRLLIRAKKNWRIAAVAAIREDRIVLTVCSDTGRNYRLRRGSDAEIFFSNGIAILRSEIEENWRENFCTYDRRW